MRKLTSTLAVLAVLVMLAPVAVAQATPSGNMWKQDDLAFEFLGQVENLTPTTSTQYGYLYHIEGLPDEQIFAGMPQNEASALFTFFSEGTTVSNVVHGKWRVITRTGTITIYFDPAHNNGAFDPVTNDRESYRDGIAVLKANWRHQVVFEVINTGLATDTNVATRHFFVTFWNTITESSSFTLNGQTVQFGKVGERFRLQLVGGPNPASPSPIGAPAKIAGYASMIGPR